MNKRTTVDLVTLAKEYGVTATRGTGGRPVLTVQGGSCWKLPVPLLRHIQDITAVPDLDNRPDMPTLRRRTMDGYQDITDAEVVQVAKSTWSAVKSHATGGRPAAAHLRWKPGTQKAILTAVTSWRLRAPDLSPYAVAAVKWESIMEWSGTAPRGPVVVLGKVNQKHIEAARALQGNCNARLLAMTPSVKGLLELRHDTVLEVQRRKPSGDQEARGILSALGVVEKAAALRRTADEEVDAQKRQLLEHLRKGGWIW